MTGIPFIIITCCSSGMFKGEVQAPLFSSTNQWEFWTSMVIQRWHSIPIPIFSSFRRCSRQIFQLIGFVGKKYQKIPWISWENLWFPVDFPVSQPIEYNHPQHWTIMIIGIWQIWMVWFRKMWKTAIAGDQTSLQNEEIPCWLVVSPPLKNISQLGWLFPIYGKIIFMFQTTNQPVFLAHVFLETSGSLKKTTSSGNISWTLSTAWYYLSQRSGLVIKFPAKTRCFRCPDWNGVWSSPIQLAYHVFFSTLIPRVKQKKRHQ